jgi:methionyl aminopeptidase
VRVDRYAAAEMKASGCKSAFLGYRQFPGNICISINEEVVHGIGGARVIQDGDIVKIDIGIDRDGWMGDNALTVPVGNVEQGNAASPCRHGGVSSRRHPPCTRWLDARRSLRTASKIMSSKYGFSVVREFVGHGVGRKLHEEPQVPNYGKKGERPRLKAGMSIAIEPMVNMGTEKTRILADKWTAITHGPQAQRPLRARRPHHRDRS